MLIALTVARRARIVPSMQTEIPAEALERARAVIDDLRDQLDLLFARLPEGPNSAIRYVAEDEQ